MNLRTYYIFSHGTLSRKENTILLESAEGKKFIPVETVDQIYLFGEVSLNTKLLTFAASKGIMIHFFNYYGFYTGTFYPKELNLSGELTVKQVEHYLDMNKRLEIARCFVEGAIHNMKRNLQKREEFEDTIKAIEIYEKNIKDVDSITNLMSIEAHCKKAYFSTFDRITGWTFERRTIQPPGNPLNALISFGNSLLYTLILKEIYLTPLNPTISYLHEPSQRRFSLSLDVSEIFKPVLVDRLIFYLINNGIINETHFESQLKGIYLNEEGRKIFVSNFEERINQTVLHRKLKRKIRYRTLIRLELYKLIKHLLGEKKYQPLKAWW